MHTVKLKIEDNIYNNIMFLLKNLDLKGFTIEEDILNEKHENTKLKIQKLFSQRPASLFNTIEDPMEWQQKQRDEWK